MQTAIIGYKVEVNKVTRTLEDVYVLVISPIGVAEIPVNEYIIFFADDADEALEVLIDSAEAVREAQLEYDFQVA